MSSTTSIAQFDHFIPVSTSRLIETLAQSGLDQQQLSVIHKLRQIITYQFSQKLINLKKLYLPFNPDRELLVAESEATNPEPCIETIRELLTSANYSELNQAQIEFALQKSSPYGLEVKIDFDAFENISLFYRGKSQDSLQVRDWKTLYLKKKPINLIRYQRLFLLLRYKNQHYKPGIHLKLFKDTLRPDLEMLFPECKIRMKVFDKLKLAITGGGGTAGGLFATISKITAAVSPWTIVIAVTGFAALIWRQISKVFIQKTRYMATLAQNLYFNNLDNNAGALTYLVDLARQEEIKEIILAYALLNLQAIDNVEQLDSACEQWFADHFRSTIDFDITDAINKLRAFEILPSQPDSLDCQPAQQILSRLDQQWLAFIASPTA